MHSYFPMSPRVQEKTSHTRAKAALLPTIFLMPVIALLLLAMSCSDRQEVHSDPLTVLQSHRWVSDQEATWLWITKHRPNFVGHERLKSIFGKLIVAYTSNGAVTTLDGKTKEIPSRILGQTDREISWIAKDAVLDRDVIVVIELDEDRKGYWIYDSHFDVREHFVPEK